MYDFLAMAYFGLLDGAMVLHHSICIFGFTASLVTGLGANFTIMGLYVTEVSNTFMHMRVILKHYGLRYTKSYEAMEISFILLYIYGRILLAPSLTWNTSMCNSNHMFTRAASLGLFFQSVYFAVQMISILRKRFKEISKRKMMRVKSRWFVPLNEHELEKLGINKDKKEKHIL
mmetsp:Transcript_32947/g.50382  ORF Transcript_32947/g.50382 Transcript_32947/m.50382 type:complete len:174 (-) Transcript_32947:55-576(-)